TGARARHQRAHWQDEATRTVAQRRVVRQRHLRLGHAYRRRAGSELVDAIEILLRLHLQVDARPAADARSTRLNRVDDRRAVRRPVVEGVRLLAGGDHGVGQVHRAGTAFAEALVNDDRLGAGVQRQLLDEGDLLLGVGGEAVDRHHAGETV